MRDFRDGSGIGAARRAVGLALLVAVGCGPREELKPDPGVSPLYPGPADASKSGAMPRPAGVGADRTTSAPSIDVDEAPLRSGDVEKQLRIALRTAEKGDLARASSLLDRILALEPVNREALSGRASVALSQAQKATSPDEKLAAVEKADAVCKRLQGAYERPSKPEMKLYSRVFTDHLMTTIDLDRLDRAVAVLKDAHEFGFEPFEAIEHDPKMAKLRAFPAYRSLAEKVHAENLAAPGPEFDSLFAAHTSYVFDFKTKDFDGKPLSLDEFKGRVLLVDLWGTWCKPCLDTIPGLIKIRDQYAPHGFDVIGLDYEKDAGDQKDVEGQVKEFVKKSGIPYRIAMFDESLQAKVPNVSAFPTTLLIDRAGKVRLQLTGGGAEALATIDAAVQVLLAEPAGTNEKVPSKPAATNAKSPPADPKKPAPSR